MKRYHCQYDSAFYVFVPSKSQREVLKNPKLQDFAPRESLVQIDQPTGDVHSLK